MSRFVPKGMEETSPLARLYTTARAKPCEWQGLFITFNEVLTDFWSDGFENVANVAQDWKVTTDGLVGLFNVAEAKVPIARGGCCE